MAAEPIDEIEAWSKNLSPWRQDCLRRLATKDDLTEADLDELLSIIKSAADLDLDAPPPTALPFAKAHFGGGEQKPIILKGIANVKNVNRLVPKAGLDFCPKALTVVYGRNGSGKSGFVRILRTACRTRVENPAKLKVLGDVYGDRSGPQTADIIIDSGGGDTSIAWTSCTTAAPKLMQVAVFDTLSAQLYVDGGNQIRYLPFGLALPHRLNAVCLEMKERLDGERATAVGNKVSLTAVDFPVQRSTKAQTFNRAVNKSTTNAEIDEEAAFSDKTQKRLDEVTSLLSAGVIAVADLTALMGWVESMAGECEFTATASSDTALSGLRTLWNTAVTARQTAQLSAGELFTDEPLPGVGSESWRAPWTAAREYSVREAYVDAEFPVNSREDGQAECVLCQQPILADGAARMARFQRYMDDMLDVAATKAEEAVAHATNRLPAFTLLSAEDFANRIEQVRHRKPKLAEALSNFQVSATQRRTDAAARLTGGDSSPVPVLVSPKAELKEFAQNLLDEKDALAKASDAQERAKLTSEKAELEYRKILTANRAKLITRRDFLLADAAYAKALTEVQTKGITQRANELVDKHLTSAVMARFDAERERFDIMHLNVGLSRKSGQTKAEFEVDPQNKLTKVTSEILSEGSHWRAFSPKWR